MIKEKIFYPKVQLRPRNFGFDNIIEVKIKLHDYTSQDIKEFVSFMEKDPHVAEIFELSGDHDFSLVIIAKDSWNLGLTTKKIRDKFNKIISTWSESLTTVVYKFERYDMLKLMGHKK